MRSYPKTNSLCLVIITLFLASNAWGVCIGVPFNPVTDLCWSCMFPIKVAGIQVSPDPPGNVIEPPDPADVPFCKCLIKYVLGIPIYRFGVGFSFWEPARYIEVVKDPFCLPYLGTDLGIALGDPLELRGSKHDKGNNEDSQVFANAHYFINPAWTAFEQVVNRACHEHQVDIPSYMTEVDPMWNDDLLSAIIHPESALCANITAQMACMADSVSSQVGVPLPQLFWCMGSWGSAYPLSGHMGDGRLVEACAGAAARLIFKLLRQFMIQDFGVNLCRGSYTPTWIKYNWRLQIAKPVPKHTVIPIGRSGTIWTSLTNPTQIPGQDNFVFVLFRKRACCASYIPSLPTP